MKENQNTEWKQTWRDEYLRWVCGFANAQGGTLHIGKNDKGQVVGLPDATRLLVEIPNKVRDILGIVVDVNLHSQGGLDWLEIVVEPYPSPISYRGEYHYRSGSTKQELKGPALEAFLIRKRGRHWDGAPIPHCDVTDLDPLAIKAFRKLAAQSGRLSPEFLAESDADLIEKLQLTEGQFLKRAATLLFHPEPQKFSVGACVKIGFFRTDANLLYHDVIEGGLISQAERTVDMLMTKYLRAGISYSGTQRFERFPVPEAALREAVVNAIVHKDYSSGTPIQVSVYAHKLMLWNHGDLPPDWSMEKLLGKHCSTPANPDVANAFFRAGKIESWGRGIELIRSACVSAGYPEPEFRQDHGGMWVEFQFPEGFGESPNTGTPNTGKISVETSVETSVQTREKTPARILRLLGKQPELTLEIVATELGKSVRAVELAVSKLVKEGKLIRVGSKKSGHWEIKQ
jgi:ATP-dependent DNA helicase RecG